MNITYIHHSGFLVETNLCYYLFDYYKGTLPGLDPQKPILVFASHRHPDHYNPDVFRLLCNQGMEDITAVLSKDIPQHKYPKKITCCKVTFHQEYQLPCGTRLQTLLSTDQGVAFVLECEEGIIYHAGDLNDWVWSGEADTYNRQMTGSYRHEIDLIRNLSIDAAFLPLDPRQERDYARGMLYFLEKIRVKKVWPMHYWEQPEVIPDFLRSYPEYIGIVQNTEAFAVR